MEKNFVPTLGLRWTRKCIRTASVNNCPGSVASSVFVFQSVILATCQELSGRRFTLCWRKSLNILTYFQLPNIKYYI